MKLFMLPNFTHTEMQKSMSNRFRKISLREGIFHCQQCNSGALRYTQWWKYEKCPFLAIFSNKNRLVFVAICGMSPTTQLYILCIFGWRTTAAERTYAYSIELLYTYIQKYSCSDDMRNAFVDSVNQKKKLTTKIWWAISTMEISRIQYEDIVAYSAIASTI